jgi:DNA-directed RNA polymerase specialized sigma24 family protein
MVIPLKKTTLDSKPYQRRAEIEQALIALDGLSPDLLVERLTCTQQAVPFEVLIYFLRHTELNLGSKHLEPIFRTFYGRLEGALRKSVSDAWIDYAVTIREELAGRIVEMIAKDRHSQEESMYYWEVNFNHALSNLCTDILRKHGPAHETDPLINARSLTEESDSGEEVSHEVDIAAAEFINPNPSKIDDAAFRLRLMHAINELPIDERRAVGLWLQGMPIESQDPEAETIAQALECRERTVSNRLKRAFEKLRIVMQAEELQ